MDRKTYLDWLRGLAVVVMVEAHVVDAWTREPDSHDAPYFWAVFAAGLAAPLFLFLAGVSTALSTSSRAARDGHHAAVTHAHVRAWQVFALALIFRVQAQVLGWGPLVNVLKVDILNVMGLTLAAAAGLWAISTSRPARLVLFAAATAAVAMIAPLVHEAAALAALPDSIEAYLRPVAARSNFSLFPWAAFLLAGVIVGDLIAAAATAGRERLLQASLAVAGIGGVALAYLASFRPSIYPASSFWSSSPTFFCIRLGLATALVPVAWLIQRGLPARFRIGTTDALSAMGRSSLFVYWIHVEMVYGVIGRPLRRALPLEGSLVATIALCALLYRIVLWKNTRMKDVTLAGPWRILAPVLK